MSARENAVQSLINGGYPDRQAREILSLVCGEAQNEGYRRGEAAARAKLETSSPWERAVAGLNALVEAHIDFWIEPDGHISGSSGVEHIEWDRKASRWVLTHDEDEDLPPLPIDTAERAAVDRSIIDQFPATAADKWNATHPEGTPVVAYPGCRPEDDSKCTRLVTRTRSAASVLGGHTAVVWVEGHSACISLTNVDPRPEGGAS
ncbi:hypothetical protein [Streptomyces parvus]|uniref:hypothetical protein n=1 Tax=Streptomyces parvus TaxID=66428 RepID=UPI00331FE6C5